MREIIDVVLVALYVETWNVPPLVGVRERRQVFVAGGPKTLAPVRDRVTVDYSDPQKLRTGAVVARTGRPCCLREGLNKSLFLAEERKKPLYIGIRVALLRLSDLLDMIVRQVPATLYERASRLQ